MIFVFWKLSFTATFSLASFTFIKRLFYSSSLSAIRVVSSALLILLPAILIPAYESSSSVFHMMYSKLKKLGDTTHPWHTSFPVHCSMSSSNCCLTCIQLLQEAGKVVWYSHLFKNFPQFVVIHTVKVFSIASEAKVDVFLEFSCFFYDPIDVGNLITGSFVFTESRIYIWKFLVHVVEVNFEKFWALPY